MTVENRVYQVLLILGTLAAAVVPTWVAFEIFNRQSPPKAIQVFTTFVNPSESLGSLKEKINLNLTIGEKTYSRLTIATVQIKNAGSTAITDSDIKAPITGSVSQGWEIVAVGEYENSINKPPQVLKWDKNADGKIVASTPFLLNPNETAVFIIYLNNIAINKPASFENPKLDWSARIVGLPKIENTEYVTPNYNLNP